MILKLICAAGNEDFDEIEKLSFVYACADFNMIDTSSDINAVNAVKKGIRKAGKENDVSVCVSIGLKDDIHFSKAFINNQKCIKCTECISICKRNAISSDFFIDEKRCIGCLKCIKACKADAISCKKKKTSIEIPYSKENIDCVEFHCSSNDEKQIMENWNKLKTIYNGQLSICMNRSKLGDERIIKLLKKMIEGNNNIIIQTDGNPMTGGVNDYKSNLQSVAFAQLVNSSGIKAKIVLSGGINAKSVEFAKKCEVNIDGVAIGSYARKLVNEYVRCKDFWENDKIIESAVKKAKTLKEALL